MKKIISISFLTLIVYLPISMNAYASATYEACGGKPSFLDRLIHDAENIRRKCIEDIYEANKEKVRLEVEELHQTSTKMGQELKKTAIKVDYNIVQCAPRTGEAARDPKLIKRCDELVKAQNAVISRIDVLMGWNERPKAKPTDLADTSSISPPCPSKAQLDQMQVARMFNRKLFQTWERCVNLAP